MKPLIGNRYELQNKLGEGGAGEVYRALDRLSGRVVALKHLRLGVNEGDNYNLRTTFAKEFQTLASLRHPHIISVLDYGFDKDRRPYFTMPLIEKPSTILEAAREHHHDGKIRLLLQLLQALAYLHRRGILHRDLKPSNVMVEGKHWVRVLDFGLAGDKAEDAVSGTITHIAPEVLLGEAATPATDLYAVGLIAYEMFCGHNPFYADDIATLAIQILTMLPELAPLRAWKQMDRGLPAPELHSVATSTVFEAPTQVSIDLHAINPHDAPTKRAIDLPHALRQITTLPALPDTSDEDRFGQIVAKLLAKNPAERYHEANAVIHDLSELIGDPIPVETVAIRESFLQAATFVGREAELKQLNDALQAILGTILVRPPRLGTQPLDLTTDKRIPLIRGSAWLIGGETGVGKSRLLEELRIRALVAGALTVRGQSMRDGGLPYQLWRDPLRQIILNTPIDDLTASILKEIVPDIETLIGRGVPPAPSLHGEAAERRLVLAIVHVIHLQKKPLVLLLEDLQWAQESLAPLKQLMWIVENLPVLIVANFRADEAPDLPEQLHGMKHIHLEPLSKANIAELSQSMLGNAGHQTEVVDLLYRETDGNVLFVIEVMRVLAENAGGLEAIGERTLPAHVLAGGVQTIVQQRLAQVAPDYYALLKVAAVIGPRLDLAVLEKAMELPYDPAYFESSWVDAEPIGMPAHHDYSTAFVVQLPDIPLNRTLDPGEFRGAWIDLEPIPKAIKSNGHHQYAEPRAIDSEWQDVIYGDKSHLRFEFPLAEWLYACAEALILEVRDDQWQFAHEKIRETIVNHLEDDEIHGIHQRVARALEMVFPNDKAQYGRLLEHWRMAGNTEYELRYIQLVAQQAYLLGNFGMILGLGERALRLLSHKEGAQSLAMRTFLSTLGAAHLSLGEYPQAHTRYEASLALARLQHDHPSQITALVGLGDVAHSQNDYPMAKSYWEEALVLSHENSHERGMAVSLHRLGRLETEQGKAEVAQTYLRESLSLSRKLDDKELIANALMDLGRVLWQQGDGTWAEAYYEEVLLLYRAIGDRRGVAESLYHLGIVAWGLGKHELARDYAEESLMNFREFGERQGIALTLNQLATIARHQRDFAAAERYANESLKLQRELGSRLGIAQCYDLLAQIAYDRGNYVEALSHSEKSLNTYKEIGNRKELPYSLCWNAFIKIAILDTRSAHSRLQDALKIAQQIGDIQGMLLALVGHARLCEMKFQYNESAMLIGVVRNHPTGAVEQIREWLEPLYEALSTKLFLGNFRAALQKGQTRPLDAVVKELLGNGLP